MSHREDYSQYRMALRKTRNLVYPRSQPPGWEYIPRGSASAQERGGGSPSRMVSQPGGWEPVRARAVF
ncbi:hypothetical protein [Nostoc sp.]|uniref:hypothetical protein n=1 Tax=Nostoc sp. TaxID=1180 RepID=UPI002FFC7B44